MLLVIAATILVGGIFVLRRLGFPLASPPLLFSLYLLLFFPVRGLTLPLFLKHPNQYGIGPDVAILANNQQAVHLADLFVLQVCLIWMLSVILVGLLLGDRAASARTSLDLHSIGRRGRYLLRSRAIRIPLFAGYVIEAITSDTSSLRVGYLPGPLVQVSIAAATVYLAFLTARIALGLPVRTTVAACALIGVSLSSKDLLLQLALALLIGSAVKLYSSRPPAQVRRTRPLRRYAFLLLVALVSLLAVLPAIQYSRVYHRSFLNASRTTLGHGPRSNLVDSLALMTNRLDGYDTILVSLPRQGLDSSFDPTHGILFSPLAALTSSGSTIGMNSLGQNFGVRYFGIDPSLGVYVASGFEAQLILSKGVAIALLVPLGLAILAVLSWRGLTRTETLFSFAAWVIVARLPFYLERDIASSIVGALRPLILLGILWTIAPYGTPSRRRTFSGKTSVTGHTPV